MQTAMEEANSATCELQSSQSEDETVFPTQMGSGRRDARVVCETFTSGRDVRSTTVSDFDFKEAASTGTRKNSKQLKCRGSAYSHSRNPLLACFIGESILPSSAIRRNPNSDSASSQKALFSLIPVDKSTVNERSEEPTSPQLSCIGQVKCRQGKAHRNAGADGLASGLNQLDLTKRKDAGGGGLASRRLQREWTFGRATDDIPRSDLNGAVESPRLMRSMKRFGGDGSSKKLSMDDGKQGSAPKHPIQQFNHLVKQLLGASVTRTGLICGWSSRDPTNVQVEEQREPEEDIAADQCEIDLSRFASCDMQPKTPSFRDSRYYQTTTGKKLPDIRVHSQHSFQDLRGLKDGEFASRLVSGAPTIIVKSTLERRKSDSDATLWQRRRMDRPLSLQVNR